MTCIMYIDGGTCLLKKHNNTWNRTDYPIVCDGCLLKEKYAEEKWL